MRNVRGVGREVYWDMRQVCALAVAVFAFWGVAEEAETWRVCELAFESSKNYAESGGDGVRLDVVFEHADGGKRLTRPGFWDGDGRFLVRFAPTKAGKWTWRSESPDDRDLDGRTGELAVRPYAGALEIYRRGFLRVEPGKKHFTYADGTPFFYLGDTHWGMMSEEIDEAGPHAGNIRTDSHFKYVVRRRVEQGFTVYQSEPIGAKFDLSDGKVDACDIEGFRQADRYYREIADAGLVHANAQFFFPERLTEKLGRDLPALERLSRYWVARFGAYPVLWTLAQEIDNDFLAERGMPCHFFRWQDNPWVKIAEFTHRADCYGHPLSEHQESTGRTTIHGGGKRVSPVKAGYVDHWCSSFENQTLRRQVGHNWWAAQMKFHPLGSPDWETVREYYADEQPAVLYEGNYCGLWTMDWGARVQGWAAFLNGMCGYGYGAIDLWLYKSTYETKHDSFDGFERITRETKLLPWHQSLEFPSARQMGYMRRFFERLPWHELTPDLGYGRLFEPEDSIEWPWKMEGQCGYSAAARGNDLYVVYLNSTNTLSGWIKGCAPRQSYRLKWFNPRTGEDGPEMSLPRAGLDGRIRLPQKPDSGDWVAEIRKGGTIRLSAGHEIEIMDFGPESVGGYPLFTARRVRRTASGAAPVLRISYSTHPDGLGDKGDFWRETSARYLGPDVDLPILPGNINRYDVFTVDGEGVVRAKYLQGQVRYVRLKLENAAEGAEIDVDGMDFLNERVHSEGERDGSFECSDARLTRLWDMSVRTCELSAIPAYDAPGLKPPMRTFPYLADGGKRDRLVWSGDLWWAERNVFYGFRAENPYMRGSLQLLAANQTPEGYVQACPWPDQPPPKAGEYGPFPSDEFAAWFVPVLWDYILYTDDASLATNLWPNVVKLLGYLKGHVEADGVFSQRPETSKHAAGLTFGGTSCHHRAYMNVLLWKTYEDASRIAGYLGHADEAKSWHDDALKLAPAVRQRFWNEAKGHFILSQEDPQMGFEANALALATCFATRKEAQRMMPQLRYHSHGKFQALAARGKFNYGDSKGALKMFADHNWYRYFDSSWRGVRTTHECTNLTRKGWGDESHPDTAIAGILSASLLGVEPVTPGFRTFRFTPPPYCGVWSAKGRVQTPHGTIEASWRRDREGHLTRELRCPPGTTCVKEEKK